MKLSCAVTGFSQATGMETWSGSDKDTPPPMTLSRAFTTCHKTVNASYLTSDPKMYALSSFIESLGEWATIKSSSRRILLYYFMLQCVRRLEATSTQFWLAWTKCLLHIHKVIWDMLLNQRKFASGSKTQGIQFWKQFRQSCQSPPNSPYLTTSTIKSSNSAQCEKMEK